MGQPGRGDMKHILFYFPSSKECKIEFVVDYRIERLMTVEEGMDAIPKHLVYRFLNASREK